MKNNNHFIIHEEHVFLFHHPGVETNGKLKRHGNKIEEKPSKVGHP